MDVHVRAFESDFALVAILVVDASVFPALFGCPTEAAWSRDVSLGWGQDRKDPDPSVE